MSVNTWEEFCQYTWLPNSGGTELFTELDGDELYYYMVYEPNRRHYWLNTRAVPVTILTDSWYITGQSPLATNLLPPQEKVLKKIALMEKRWLDFQFRKSHQTTKREQHAG